MPLNSHDGVCVYVCVPDIYQKKTTNKQTNQKSRQKLPNLHTKRLLCFYAEAPLRPAVLSKLEQYKGADGKGNSPMGPDTI